MAPKLPATSSNELVANRAVATWCCFQDICSVSFARLRPFARPRRWGGFRSRPTGVAGWWDREILSLARPVCLLDRVCRLVLPIIHMATLIRPALLGRSRCVSLEAVAPPSSGTGGTLGTQRNWLLLREVDLLRLRLRKLPPPWLRELDLLLPLLGGMS